MWCPQGIAWPRMSSAQARQTASGSPYRRSRSSSRAHSSRTGQATRRPARRLVVSGFFNDIIGKIGVPEVTDHLHDVIEEKLARAAELSASAKAVVGQ